MKGIWITTLMLGGALAAGGGAAYFVKGYVDGEVQAEREQLQKQYRLVNVVVAKANLAPGAVLSSQTVAVREVPNTFLHADAVRSEQWGEIAGRVLSRPVAQRRDHSQFSSCPRRRRRLLGASSRRACGR